MTLQLDVPLEDGQWLVQLAANDVRVMPHEQLVGALRAGGIFPGVFVWRRGMSQWLVAGTVPELVGALRSRPAAPAAPRWMAPEQPLHAPQRQEYVPRHPEYAPDRQEHAPQRQERGPWVVSAVAARETSPPLHVTLLATAVTALLAVLLTSYALALGGVFDGRGVEQDAAGHAP